MFGLRVCMYEICLLVYFCESLLSVVFLSLAGVIVKHIIDNGFWLVTTVNINLKLIEPQKILLSYVNIFIT